MKEQIRQICLKNIDIESCGLILENGDDLIVFECENIHYPPKNGFEISVQQFREAEEKGEVIGIYHSHTKDCLDFPSMFDLSYSELTGYFNIVYIIGRDSFHVVDPNKTVKNKIKEKLGL